MTSNAWTNTLMAACNTPTTPTGCAFIPGTSQVNNTARVASEVVIPVPGTVMQRGRFLGFWGY